MANYKDIDGVNAVNGIGTKISNNDVTTPTQAELITAFGPIAANAGKIFISNDNGANTTYKIIICDGTKYAFSATLTVAA